MTHLKTTLVGSVELVVDGRIFSRSLIKQAAATTSSRCHVLLDLDADGNVKVTFSQHRGEADPLREVAGDFGNLLIAELTQQKLDAQTVAARNLLFARALDGALPRDQILQDPVEDGAQHDE